MTWSLLAIRKSVADVFELGLIGQQIDGQDVEADGNAAAVARGQLPKPRCGQFAELPLLGGVDGGFGGEEIARGAGLHFEDDERVAVPGDEVEIAADAG